MSQFIFPVEAGHMLMFARAVGHRAGADIVAAPDQVAAPTFVQAAAQFDPDYPLRPVSGQPWFGSGRTPSGVEQSVAGGGSLHAEQHFEYVRPLRAGEVLAVSSEPGRTWEKTGRRGGRMVFTEVVTDYRDASGNLVVRSRGVAVRPEAPVAGPR